MDYMLFGSIGSLVALLFASIMFKKVRSHDEGTEKMIKISKAIIDKILYIGSTIIKSRPITATQSSP